MWEWCHSLPCVVGFWKRSGCSSGSHWGVQEKQMSVFKGEMGLSFENLVFVGFDNEDGEGTVWEGCHSLPCVAG